MLILAKYHSAHLSSSSQVCNNYYRTPCLCCYLMLFAQGDASLVTILTDTLDHYANMARLHAKKLKVRIYMVGLDDCTNQSLLEVSGF